MPVPQPPSLSVYRGQSRTGEGEGPGKTVLHGEQYIRIDPALRDTELLETIRPWMTLDSDPADHQRLSDRLEAWSLFPAGGFLFVVRLVSAGIYDRRAAYFAHGRAWKLDQLPAAFDPGLHLGRSDAFDLAWRDERAGAASPEVSPSVVRVEQVKGESQTAVRFLAHLLHALTESHPLIIASPVSEFASGGTLHALVALARAGLPSNVRRRCSVRVYSRFPELFLRHLSANLVVVPEDVASNAIAARPSGTLIDRQGRVLAGKEPSDRAVDYATAVVDRAIAIPDGLPSFTERVRDLATTDARVIPITYNLAFAFAGPADRRSEVLRRYLPRAADKLGPGLRWSELIAGDEWNAFPRDALLDELLMDTSALSAGRRGLLSALEDGASRLGLRVDERLSTWWDSNDAAKLSRLLELLAHDPPLVSPRAAAERTAEVPLERLTGAGSLASLLQAEASSGYLSRRQNESADLARAASDRAIFDALTRAASRLEPEWARTYVRNASREALVDAAQCWLDEPAFFDAAVWSDVPTLLLDRLRAIERPPGTLAQTVERAAMRLDLVKQFDLYLRLADLLARIDEGNPLASKLWSALRSLSDSQRATLEQLVLDPAWRVLRLDRIELANLLDLANGFRRRESLDRLHAELDRRMRLAPVATAEALVRSGWWYFWRKRSHLTRDVPIDADALQQSALAWLGSDAWRNGEATLEAWDLAVADLPRALDAGQVARLRDDHSGKARWPWIPPFEREQFDDLADRAGDLGVLAEFAEAAAPRQDGALGRSQFRGQLPADALAWLAGSQGPSLTLNESAYLHAHAGHRESQALAARVDAVAGMFDRDPRGALEASDRPKLWSDPRFLARIAEWMAGKSLAEITPAVAKSIDERIAGEPAFRPRTTPGTLVRELTELRLHSAARLLHHELATNLHEAAFADELVAALVDGDVAHASWQELGRRLESDGGSAVSHPLGLLAQRIRATDFARDRHNRLAQDGWTTFMSALRANNIPVRPTELGIVKLFELAASMLPGGGIGIAALQLSFYVADDATRAAHWWWVSVLRAMRDWKRHGEFRSADDRESAAIALLSSHLEEPAQQALSHALRLIPQAAAIAAEFGERTS